MAYSHLPYPSNPSLEQVKVLSADSVIYVSTTGSDATGDGSASKPFASLVKAMQTARQYTIVGDAVLSIRLLKGEYTLSTNVDLYHPQGSNIVIEGDPSAFQQRFLHQVQNYTWSLEQFAGSGHTGSISLFDGVTTGTATEHGLSGSEGQYFAITNAAFGSRSYNSTTAGANGVYSATDTYSNIFNGDRFFNHGYSFEDAQGILGIGRILGATSSSTVARVEFSNPNIDTRCPALHFDGGLSNSLAWGGVASNYPQTQYSQPNGYYGNAAWKNNSGGTNYPSVSGSHNTVDPYILSTYPVVIRSPHDSNVGTLVLKNGNLRAIRNIFFTTSDSPYVPTTGSGVTLNYSQALTALTDQDTPLTVDGVGLYLENANVGIRHLGFRGVGTAVFATNSNISVYTDDDPTEFTGAVVKYGTPNTLNNSPIICTTQCKIGIVARNSNIQFAVDGGGTQQFYADYRMSGAYISATRSCIRLENSRMRATSLHLDCVADICKFRLDVALPIFPGSTVANGDTAGFNAFAGTATFFDRYPAAKVFAKTSAAGATDVEIGYINQARLISTSVVTGTDFPSGTTTSATLVGGTAPVAYHRYALYGVKTAPGGLSYMSTNDIRSMLFAGGTMSVAFYRDRALSGASAQYILGRSSVLVSGRNGFTQGFTNIASNSDKYLQNNFSFGVLEPYTYGSYSSGAFSIRDGSSVVVDKVLLVTNGGYNAVDVRKNSSLVVGDRTFNGFSNADSDDYNYPPITNGCISVTSFGGSAISVRENSRLSVGTVFAKHPLFADVSLSASNNPAGPTPIIRVQRNSSADIGSVYAVTHPAGKIVNDASTVPLWSSFDGAKYGHHRTTNSPLECFVRVSSNSNLFLSDAGSAFAFDGGTADFKVSAPNYSVFTVEGASNLVSTGSLADNTATGAVKTKLLADTRATQNIMTRSVGSYIYGFAAASSRQWTGTLATATGYTGSSTNLGPATTTGVTLSVNLNTQGRATN